jgi:MFS family permease
MKKPFYGWTVLACLFLVYFASNGIGLNTLSKFLPEFMKAFKIDPEKATGLPKMLYLVLALPLPFVGYLIEKVPSKKLMWIGAIGASFFLLYLSFVNSYQGLLVYFIGYPLCLCLCGFVTSIYIINKWFSKNKGLAIGIFLTASSFAPVIFKPLSGYWIEQFGWHNAALYLGIIGCVLLLIPCFFIKNQPADVDTYPDGEQQAIPQTNNNSFEETLNASKSNNTKFWLHPQFYLLIIVTGILWFCITGFVQNQDIFLNDFKDLSGKATKTGFYSSLFFVCSLLAKLVFGKLGDSYNKKNIMLLSIVNLLIGASLLYLSINNQSFLIPGIIVFGFGFSGTFTMIQLFIAWLYYGPAYGKVLGTLSFIDTLAGSYGIGKLGAWRKAEGNYAGGFQIMMILCVIALVATFLVKKQEAKTLNV